MKDTTNMEHRLHTCGSTICTCSAWRLKSSICNIYAKQGQHSQSSEPPIQNMGLLRSYPVRHFTASYRTIDLFTKAQPSTAPDKSQALVAVPSQPSLPPNAKTTISSLNSSLSSDHQSHRKTLSLPGELSTPNDIKRLTCCGSPELCQAILTLTSLYQQ